MCADLPKRLSVVEQAAEYIRSQIATGYWVEKLPSLRALHSKLQVSRNTLQRALVQLEHEGIVQRMDRSRAVVLQSASIHQGGAREQKVGWLDGESPSSRSGLDLRDAMHFQIALQERNISFEMFLNQSVRQRYSLHQLENWVRERKVTTWILANVSAEVQNFYAERGISTIVVGTKVPQLDLPAIDLSARAICRHAAGRMAKAGHQRIALLLPRRSSFDDKERELGFAEALNHSKNRLKGHVLRHDGTNVGISACLDRAFSRKDTGPTGLIVSRATEAISAVTHLGCVQGLRVPADVSLISLAGDLSFANTIPAISHYAFERQVIVRKLFRMISHEDPTVHDHDVEFAAKFHTGETVAAPRI